MRSRTVASAVLLSASLMGLGAGSAHAEDTTPITAPHGAANWGDTTQSGYSNGSTSTYDNEIHNGTASNFGQEITNYGSQGTDYNNQPATSDTASGPQTHYGTD
ncbi:hypothetical protein [Kitasatospora sp. NPDC059827]|uniref:hypothetical protein n=1 Tax=Kitasatospora sp. NPDC059827 TaxID=3346964 RepID=UPI0036691C89